jgi:hypothetical protein
MTGGWDSRTVVAIISEAAARLDRDLKAALPRSAPAVAEHFKLAGSHSLLVGSLLGPRSFPSLVIPFWMAPETSWDDRQFVSDVAYSTLSGFLFIRLIDNVMDGDSSAAQRKLLPSLGFFHTRFQAPYYRYFSDGHPFWTFFERAWYEHTDATTNDGFTDVIDADTFMQVAGRKFSATKVPVAATALRYSTSEIIEPWFEFIDHLGRFAQMANDFFDWHHDDKFSIQTHIRSEWSRRRSGDESLATWYLREGFEWGLSLLEDWAANLEREAASLKSRHAERWLAGRIDVFHKDVDKLARGLRPITAVYNAWLSLESQEKINVTE